VSVVEVAVPQQMRALQRANEVRSARTRLRKEVKAGEIAVADLVADPPEVIHGMEIFELLTAQRRWGRVKALRLLAIIQLRENKMIGEMTERQRRFLVHLLDPDRGW
jgi:hypothetical protein